MLSIKYRIKLLQFVTEYYLGMTKGYYIDSHPWSFFGHPLSSLCHSYVQPQRIGQGLTKV